MLKNDFLWGFSILLISILIASCESSNQDKDEYRSDFRLSVVDTLKVPTTGRTFILAHSRKDNEIIAINDARQRLLIYNYEKSDLVGDYSFTENPDHDPGIFYSAGYYQDDIYILGSNGVFFYTKDGVFIRALRDKTATNIEHFAQPSYILNSNGIDYLICRLKSSNTSVVSLVTPTLLKEARFLTAIPLNDEVFSFFMFGKYEATSNLFSNDLKIPRTGVLYTVYEDRVHLILKSNPKIWTYKLNLEDPLLFENNLLIDFPENYYLLPVNDLNNFYDLDKNTVMNTFYRKFLVDPTNGNTFFTYQKPFDEKIHNELIKGGMIKINEEWGNYERNRLAKFDKDLNKVFELELSNSISYLNLVYDDKLFFHLGGVESEDSEQFVIAKVNLIQ